VTIIYTFDIKNIRRMVGLHTGFVWYA